MYTILLIDSLKQSLTDFYFHTDFILTVTLGGDCVVVTRVSGL